MSTVLLEIPFGLVSPQLSSVSMSCIPRLSIALHMIDDVGSILIKRPEIALNLFIDAYMKVVIKLNISSRLKK